MANNYAEIQVDDPNRFFLLYTSVLRSDIFSRQFFELSVKINWRVLNNRVSQQIIVYFSSTEIKNKKTIDT
jgi:hypothetical protein